MTTRHADTWKQHAQKYKTLIASYSPPLIRSSLWLLSSSYLESSKWNKNTKKSRSLHHKLFMYKICSASFFFPSRLLGAPTYHWGAVHQSHQGCTYIPERWRKTVKIVHPCVVLAVKLLKEWISYFWKMSRSYEKDWPKWWSLGVQKLRFISWKHRDDLVFQTHRIVLRCHDPMKITHDLETGILPHGITEHHWSIGEQTSESKHLKLLPDIVYSSFMNSEAET